MPTNILTEIDPTTLSTAEAAEQLGCSRSTVIRLWRDGILPGKRHTGRTQSHIRLDRRAILAFNYQRYLSRRNAR